ncbi:hypothetical protein D3C81_1854310 [compost metagenome]
MNSASWKVLLSINGMPMALRRTETFCASPLSGCTPEVGGNVSWVFQVWHPERLSTLATAAATPNRGRKDVRAGEAMAKLLQGGSTNKGATLVSGREPRKRGPILFQGLPDKSVDLQSMASHPRLAWRNR